VTAEGEQIAGDPASKTLTLHRRIFGADDTARCVIHTHSTNLVAITLQGAWHSDDIIPPITPYFVMKVGHVPLVPYHRPGDPAVGDIVSSLIEGAAVRGSRLRAVMLDRLGPNVWHQSPAQAMATLWRRVSPPPKPLGEPELEALASAFGAGW